jgi:U32 family peptidase
MADTKIGQITHYYDKIAVAVLELTGSLKVGQTIRISGHGNEFTQNVSSMQVEHAQIEMAKKGDAVGMKVDQAVKEGDEVYLVKE